MAGSELAAATSGALTRRLGRIKAAAKADQPSITVVVISVSFGLLAALAPITGLGWVTAHYGPAGVWDYFAYYLAHSWAVGVMIYILLNPGTRRTIARPGTGDEAGLTRASRQAIINRCLLWSTLLVFFLQQIPDIRHPYRWETLLLSGWLALIIGLELAGRTPGKLDQALRRLFDRKALVSTEVDRDALVPPEVVDSLKQDIGRPWGLSSVVWAALVALALLIIIPGIISVTRGFPLSEIGWLVSVLLFYAAAGATAGSWIGRMITYGRLTSKKNLRKRKLQIQVIPSHPDGAGGLKPLGDFHLYQSLTASLAAIFLAVWVLLLWLGSRNQIWRGYRGWLHGYVILLLVAILVEILVFIVPLISIHEVMKAQKERDFLTKADKLFPPGRWESALDERRKAELDADKQSYKELENAPVWPIDSSIRRRFTLTNLGLLIPVVGYITQLSNIFRGLG
jgi:hypothetical protein